MTSIYALVFSDQSSQLGSEDCPNFSGAIVLGSIRRNSFLGADVAATCWVLCNSACTLVCSAWEAVRAAVIWITWASSASRRLRASSDDIIGVVIARVGCKGRGS